MRHLLDVYSFINCPCLPFSVICRTWQLDDEIEVRDEYDICMKPQVFVRSGPEPGHTTTGQIPHDSLRASRSRWSQWVEPAKSRTSLEQTSFKRRILRVTLLQVSPTEIRKVSVADPLDPLRFNYVSCAVLGTGGNPGNLKVST